MKTTINDITFLRLRNNSIPYMFVASFQALVGVKIVISCTHFQITLNRLAKLTPGKIRNHYLLICFLTLKTGTPFCKISTKNEILAIKNGMEKD
jgi:hypothetical protein